MTGNALQLVTFLMNQDRARLWDLKEHKERRSLNANSYFHVLCDKLRQYNGVTMARQKNELLAAYGQLEYLDGEQVYFKSQIPPEKLLEQEHLHLQFITFKNDGYFYRVCRGSHTYDTAEMSALLDGVIEDCKSCGIETATPEEIERMKQLYEQNH